MSYSSYLIRNIEVNTIDLSNDLLKEGKNHFGIAFNEVNRLHAKCMELSSAEVIPELTELVANGVQLSQYINEFGFTLLFFVRNPETVTFLIDQSVDSKHTSNASDATHCDYATPGTSALHYACRNAFCEAAKVLALEVSIHAADEDDCTPLSYLEELIQEERFNRENGFGRMITDEQLSKTIELLQEWKS